MLKKMKAMLAILLVLTLTVGSISAIAEDGMTAAPEIFSLIEEVLMEEALVEAVAESADAPDAEITLESTSVPEEAFIQEEIVSISEADAAAEAQPASETAAEPAADVSAEPAAVAECTPEASAAPEAVPSAEVSAEETPAPELDPEASIAPDAQPSAEPTVEPTVEPVVEPSAEPTPEAPMANPPELLPLPEWTMDGETGAWLIPYMEGDSAFRLEWRFDGASVEYRVQTAPVPEDEDEEIVLTDVCACADACVELPIGDYAEGLYTLYITAVLEDGSAFTGSFDFMLAMQLLPELDDASNMVFGDFKYSDAKGGVAITGYTGTNADVIIPAEIDGKPVVSIHISAFNKNETIRSVEIGKNVELIGSSAFADSTLESVRFAGNKLATIDSYAFSGTALAAIEIPASVTKIGTGAFNKTLLTSINIPASVTGLSNVFDGCNQLKEITLNGQTYMYPTSPALTDLYINGAIPRFSNAPFSACTGEVTVHIGEDIEEIQAGAFINQQISYIELPDSLKTIGKSAFSSSGLKRVRIPDGVEEIGESAFESCANLESVEFGAGLKTIGREAFRGCKSLKAVEIGGSIERIGYRAFYVSALESVSFTGDKLTSIGGSAFAHSMLTSINIPASVTEYGDYIIDSCSQLKEVTLNGCAEIDFTNCPALTDIYFNGTLPKFNKHIFSAATGEVTVHIGEGIEEIPYYAFRECNIAHVNLPSSLKVIGGGAFAKTKLTEITIPEGVIRISGGAFNETPITSISIPASVTDLGRILEKCNQLKEITLNGCTYIPFANCPALTDVYLNVSVPVFSVPAYYTSNAFTACREEVTIHISEGIESIPDSAFLRCNISHVELPESLKSIGAYAFSDTNLKEISIPDSVESVGKHAFDGCGKLESVKLSPAMTEIADYLFESCVSLKEIEIPENVTILCSGAFSNTGLERIHFAGDALTEIGRSAFYSCTFLKAISIPENVKVIRSQAFFNCDGLEEVVIPDSVTEIGNLFSDCGNLVYVDLGRGVSKIPQGTFQDCVSLTMLVLRSNITSIAGNDPDKNGPVVLGVEPGSYAEQMAIRSGYNWQYIFGGEMTVTANLPTDTAAYAGCRLILEHVGASQRSVIRLGSSSSFNFAGLEAGGVYRLSLLDAYGFEISPAQTFTVTKETTEIDLTAIPRPCDLSAAAANAAGEDLSANVVFRWYDENGKIVHTGAAMPGVAPGTQLRVSAVPVGELATRYLQAESAAFAASAGMGAISLLMQGPARAALFGRLVDAASGKGVSGAEVLVEQRLNNGLITHNVLTGEDGAFSLSIADIEASILLRRQNYFDQTIKLASPSAEGSLGDIALSPLAGPTISLNITKMEAVEDGEEAASSRISDLALINFELHNLTKDSPITNFVAQNGGIVLLEGAEAGDEIRIRLHSADGSFASAETTAVLGDRLTANADASVLESGSFRAEFGYVKENTNSAMIYNAAGELVTSLTFGSELQTSGRLPDGKYSVVFMGYSQNIRSIQKLSDFSAFKLKEITDYIRVSVNIRAGAVSVLKIDGIPELNEDKLLYTEERDTTFSVNNATTIAGSYVAFRAETAFRKEYKDRVENPRWIFEYSNTLNLYNGSVSAGGDFNVSHESDAGRLIVWPSSVEDTLRFCLTPTIAGKYPVSAYLEFELDGETIRQGVSALDVTVQDLTFYAPETTGFADPAITGTAPARSTVRVYLDGVYAGQTTANSIGRWQSVLKLPAKYSYSSHEVYVVVETPNGEKVTSETVEITYVKGEVSASRVRMQVYAPSSSGFGKTTLQEVVMDFKRPSLTGFSYSYWVTYPTFTFIVEIDDVDPAVVEHVFLTVFTTHSDTDYVVLECEYSEEAGGWVGTEKFSQTNRLPMNFKADVFTVTNEEDPTVDPEALEDLVEKSKAEWEEFFQNVQTLPETEASEMKVEVLQDTLVESNGLIKGCGELYAYPDADSRIYAKVSASIISREKIGEIVSSDKDYIDLEDGSFIKAYDSGVRVEISILDTKTGQRIDLTASLETREAQVYTVRNGSVFSAAQFIPVSTGSASSFIARASAGWVPGLNIVIPLIDIVSNEDDYYTSQNEYDDLEKRIKEGCGLIPQHQQYLLDKNEQAADMDRRLHNGRNLCDLALVMMGVVSLTAAVCGAAITAPAWGIALAVLGIGAGLFAFIQKKHNQAAQKEIEDLLDKNWLLTKGNREPVDGGGGIADAFNPNANGTCKDYPYDPNGPGLNVDLDVKHDPSGYIYEAVPSNRVQGATATLYHKAEKFDIYGDPYTVEEVATDVDTPQVNPQITDVEGRFAWDVPEGFWQVRVTKEGYEEARSKWLEVLPPHFDVNLGIVSYDQPEVADVTVTPEYVEIEFTRYMMPDRVTTSTVMVNMDGQYLDGRVEAVNAETDPATDKTYASIFRFIPEVSLENGREYEVRVGLSVRSYAGVTMNATHVEKIIAEERVRALAVEERNIYLDTTMDVTISAQPASAAAGKTVTVISGNSLFFSIEEKTVTLDENGQAVLKVYGKMNGADVLSVQLDGTTMIANGTITVSVPKEEIIVAIPTSSVESGEIPYGTEVELYCATEGATIYYTLDGSCPCDEETRIKYTGPIAITRSCTLRAMAAMYGATDSGIGKFGYVVIYDPTESLSLTARGDKLGVGGTMQIEAATLPVSASPEFTWTSSKPEIASVDANGMVTGVKAGTAVITAATTDGSGISAAFTITVGKYVNEITISGADVLASGKKTTLKASVSPSGANKNVSWTSNNPEIAKVTAKGAVTAAKNISEPTEVIITATAKDGSGIRAEKAIMVYPAATAVTITDENGDAVKTVSIDLAGDDLSLQLGAALEPANACPGVKWSSSNAKVVSVDENGCITALKKGSATITATALDGSGKKASCTVKVATLVKAIEITGADTLTSGKKTTLKAVVSPADAATKTVSWTSSDTNIAKVTAKGVVTAGKNIAEPTKVIITATAKDGSGVTAEKTITVYPAATGVSILNAEGEAVSTIEVSLDSASLQLSAIVEPAGASPVVKWTSSSAKLATVDADGKVTLLKKGTVTITAKTENGKKDTVKIKVV